MALREEEEGGERNGGEGDRPVAANLRVVEGSKPATRGG
jgi:hypothetical protein